MIALQVPLHGFEPLFRDGRCCGLLREAGFGFSVNSSIGYGMVGRSDDGGRSTDSTLPPPLLNQSILHACMQSTAVVVSD